MSNVPKEGKDFGIYNTAYDSASQPYSVHPSPPSGNERVTLTLRGPVPLPRSQPVYDDVNDMPGAGAAGRAGDFQHEHPPSYISVIGDLGDKLKEDEVDNGYVAMNKNATYETPRAGPRRNKYEDHDLNKPY